MYSSKLTGLRELTQRLNGLPDKLRRRRLRGMVEAGAEVIRAEAERHAPIYTGGNPKVKPGQLKGAIYAARVPSECTSVLEVWQVNVKRRGSGGAPQAAWVEYGTVTMAPQPYMRPAWDAKKAAALAAMGSYLALALPDIARG